MTNSQFNNSSDPLSKDGFNIKDEVFKYLYHWKWFVACVLLFVSLAYLHLRKSPNIFVTEAFIQVVDPSGAIEMPRSGFVFKRTSINLENEINTIKSYSIVENVVKQLHLNYKYYAIGTIKTTEIIPFPLNLTPSEFLEQKLYGDYTVDFFDHKMRITTNTGVVHDFDTYNTDFREDLPFQIVTNSANKINLNDKSYLINVSSVKSSVIRLKNALDIRQVGKQSHFLSLSLNGENPVKSKIILDALMEVYKEDGINDRKRVYETTLDFIEGRFVSLESQLDSVEMAKEQFKIQNNIIDLAEISSSNLKALSESEKEFYRVSNQIQIAKTISDALNADEIKRLPINMLEGEALNGLIGQYNSIIDRYSKLSLTSGKNNPSLIYTIKKLEDYKININSSLIAYLRDLEFSREMTSNRMRKFDAKIANTPTQEKDFRGIDRQLDIKENLYLFLLEKREESAINLANTQPSIKIVDYALTTGGAISPRPTVIYAGSILFGLLLPFGVFFVIFMLDTKIHGKADVDNLKTNIPVIAEIPLIKNKAEMLFSRPNDTGVLAEAFRILSANINFIIPKISDNTGSVIYCTSAIKGEGKTYVSINLSLALSSIGKRVLLIGADLRNPQIHSDIGLDKNNNGLSSYLYDQTFNWRDGIINGFENHPDHDIILSGSIPPNPANLLTNGRFETLLDEAKKEYDYVIVDTAPCILVTDTMLISEFADATIFVGRSDYTEKKLFEFSQNLSETGKIKNMAYVINGVGSKKGYGYRYGYGYSYNYGYGYGYGSDKS